jgi:hypothetical protein
MHDSIFDDANLLKYELDGGAVIPQNLFTLVRLTLQVNQPSDEKLDELSRTTRLLVARVPGSSNENAKQHPPGQFRQHEME